MLRLSLHVTSGFFELKSHNSSGKADRRLKADSGLIPRSEAQNRSEAFLRVGKAPLGHPIPHLNGGAHACHGLDEESIAVP
jgi:hypothetical protein